MLLDTENNNQMKLIFPIYLSVIFVLLSYYSYSLFQFIVELITAIVGYTMIVIIINTKNFSISNTYSFLGIAYSFIGSINLLHAIFLKDMNVVNVASSNISIQLRIIAAYTNCISLLLAFIFMAKPYRKINYTKIIGIYSLVLLYSIAVIYKTSLFPTCYIEGIGLTKFKIISECFICIVLIISMYFFNKNRNVITRNEYLYLLCSIVFTIVSEICFIFYSDIHDFSYMLGHIFKFLSFSCIHILLVKKNLKEPYNIIFKNLNESLEKLKRTNDDLFSKNKELEDVKNELQKYLKTYKDFLDIHPLAILIRHEDTIVYLNNKAKELLKFDRKRDILGKSVFDIFEDGYKEIVKQRIAIESKDKIGLPLHEKYICSDGSIVDAEVTVASICIDNKEYYMGVLKDMTDVDKLDAIKKELEEKTLYEMIRNEFFANISHELRTPVNVIFSTIQLQEMCFVKEDYKNLEKHNKIVKQNCLRLLKIINNLIDITKIDAGFLKPVLRYTNIVEVVENIVLSIVTYVESRDMNIVFDTQIEEEYVICDPSLIERIMLNLLSNSIKYGKLGGNIFVSISNDLEGAVFISVKDDGIGIPKDKQDRIFERFVRVEKYLKRNCEGSGIGLSLVKALVEIQNGAVVLNSEEDVGTEVIMKFPIAEIQEEICTTLESGVSKDANNIIEKIELEFSDIYGL